MWKYIVLNSLWFAILFLVHFVGSSREQKIVFGSIFLTAGYLAFKTTIDPFAWLYYLLYSLLVFKAAGQFRQWIYAGTEAVDEELSIFCKKLEAEKESLADRSRETDALGARANEIVGFYDEVKEMSKSLDLFETFLIFGEALANSFEFRVIKLALFSEEQTAGVNPYQIYELGYADFQTMIDRSVYLKDSKKAHGRIYPFDQKVYRYLFKDPNPLEPGDPKEDFYSKDDVGRRTSFAAYPIVIHEKIFAILTVVGLKSKKDQSLFGILVERFISEMQRVRLYGRVERLAITDGLTGVYVRRHLLERFEEEVDRCKRFNFRCSFLMVDIDHFKRFNDEYGHLVGDVVLKQVALLIRKNIREVDLVGRYGGEEFGVLLVDTDEAGALIVAERIRRSVQSKHFNAYDEILKVTISIGCATFSVQLDRVSPMVEAADSALYQSKRQGRNRVSVHHSDPYADKRPEEGPPNGFQNPPSEIV